MALYDADGKIRTTTVDGLTRVGVYAADGSINVVLDDVSTTGLYHPSGAIRMNTTPGTSTYDPTGAYYINHFMGNANGAV